MGISNISYITQWFGDLAIWFVVETSKQKFLIKVTKELIETREISSLIDTDKFTCEKKQIHENSKVIVKKELLAYYL